MSAAYLPSALYSAEPARRALLVGIDNYKWADPASGFNNIHGASGDADWLKSILTSKYGFRDADVIVLKDAEATRRNIIDKFRSHLIAQSKTGDVALFYFAGHGSQRLSPPYKIPPASIIETTIIPQDSRDPDGTVFDIAQSELHTLFAALLQKTQNVTSILDSCFSATTVRGDAVIRSIPADTRDRPPETLLQDAVSRGIVAPVNPVEAAVRIAAAGANQLSEEYSPDNQTWHGAMSFYLFRELESANPKTTWRDVMDRVRAEVRQYNVSQDPQLEAPDPDSLLFGGAGIAAAQPYITANREGQGVVLDAGSVHTLSAGTRLDIYSPAELNFTGQPLASVAVSSVQETTSRAKLVSGSVRDIQPGSRAVIRQRPLTTFRFHVFFNSPDALVSEIQKKTLANVADAQSMPSPAGADAVVRLDNSGIHIEHRDGTIMSEPVSVSDNDAADHVARLLGEWAEWYRKLDAAAGPTVVQLKLLTPDARPLPDEIRSDARFTLNLCNTGSQAYYAGIFIFSSAGQTTEFKSFSQYGKPIPPGPCVQAGGSLTMAPPPGRKSGVEFIVVYATDKPVNLDFLTQGFIRGDDTPSWSAAKVSVRVTRP